jgi:hypothetical protein
MDTVRWVVWSGLVEIRRLPHSDLLRDSTGWITTRRFCGKYAHLGPNSVIIAKGDKPLRWIAPLFAICSILCAQSTRDVTTQAGVGSGLVPGFYKGYLYFVEPYDQVRLFAPDGHFVTSILLQGHGDERGYVHSVAVDSDGTIAVGWGTRYGPTGIEVHDVSGNLIRRIDTGLFFPDNIDFAADHSLWAFGWQRAAEHSQVHAEEYPMLRHYSPTGTELGAGLPRSKFPRGMEPGSAQWQERRIYVMPDFVGLVAFSGNTSNQQEWVEVDLDGNIRGRWRLDGMPFPALSLTSDGHVYAKRRDPKTQWDKIVVRLDREASHWQVVPIPADGVLYGSDGDQLVFGSRNAGVMVLHWFNQPL